MTDIKTCAIVEAMACREKAILLPNHCHKVGAAIYTENEFYGGFNVQNRSHKSYHAEELAIINCMLNGVDGSTVKGIIITFSSNNMENLTFACGHCRQMLWEYTANPSFVITEITPEGKIMSERLLGDLYPLPYPHAEKEAKP